MPSRPPQHRPRAGKRTAPQIYDRWRGSAASRGYDRTWRRLREAHLDAHPLCVDCERAGQVTAATEVDHIIRIEVRPDLRLDPENLQSLCKPHHSAKTATEQRR